MSTRNTISILLRQGQLQQVLRAMKEADKVPRTRDERIAYDTATVRLENALTLIKERL